MCVVNSDLVEEVSRLVGTQAEIMRRVGISWNSWVKIVNGLPIRLSVGERLRSRVLNELRTSPDIREKFPSAMAADGVDELALEEAFLKPASVHEGED